LLANLLTQLQADHIAQTAAADVADAPGAGYIHPFYAEIDVAPYRNRFDRLNPESIERYVAALPLAVPVSPALVGPYKTNG
jgi:hypothetical protein